MLTLAVGEGDNARLYQGTLDKVEYDDRGEAETFWIKYAQRCRVREAGQDPEEEDRWVTIAGDLFAVKASAASTVNIAYVRIGGVMIVHPPQEPPGSKR